MDTGGRRVYAIHKKNEDVDKIDKARDECNQRSSANKDLKIRESHKEFDQKMQQLDDQRSDTMTWLTYYGGLLGEGPIACVYYQHLVRTTRALCFDLVTCSAYSRSDQRRTHIKKLQLCM